MTIWAKIGGTFALAVSCFEYTWEILVGDGNGWVGFVIFQKYIVARLILLDEGIL